MLAAMKSNAYVHGRNDRLSTWEELGEVITLLADLRQLQFPLEAALDLVEKTDAPSSSTETELWIDASDEGTASGGIESLANVVVGRRDRPN